MNELKVDLLLENTSERTLVQQNTNAERRTHAVDGADIDALDNVQRSQEVTDSAESVEEKPWRRAGVDISDYFNFGFDEQTWIAYCKKHTQLCAANRGLYTKRERHTTCRETEPAPSTSSGLLASRVSTIDQTGKRSRPRLESNEGKKVATEMIPEEVTVTYHLNPEFSSVYAHTAPTSLFCQPGGPVISNMATLDSGHTKEFDGPSSSQDPCSSGSLIYSAGVMKTAKAWEYVARCDQGKERSRDQRHGRDSKGENSGEEQTRHRDTTERGHKRQSVREEEELLTESMQKKSGCSSSSSRRSGREDGEDRESQSRHKHKKAKRNKDKEKKKKKKKSTADPERKLKSD